MVILISCVAILRWQFSLHPFLLYNGNSHIQCCSCKIVILISSVLISTSHFLFQRHISLTRVAFSAHTNSPATYSHSSPFLLPTFFFYLHRISTTLASCILFINSRAPSPCFPISTTTYLSLHLLHTLAVPHLSFSDTTQYSCCCLFPPRTWQLLSQYNRFSSLLFPQPLPPTPKMSYTQLTDDINPTYFYPSFTLSSLLTSSFFIATSFQPTGASIHTLSSQTILTLTSTLHNRPSVTCPNPQMALTLSNGSPSKHVPSPSAPSRLS